MKTVLYVADAGSIHTQRWLVHYYKRGWDVHVASFKDAEIPGVRVHLLPSPVKGLGKISYILSVPKIKKIALDIKPDLIHAHYITSFGVVAAISGLQPLILTGWGSDILINPGQSRLANFLTRFAISRARHVTVVAAHMMPALESLNPRRVPVSCIPFGVDTNLFHPRDHDGEKAAAISIISTRNLEPIYDLQTLLRAIKICLELGIKIEATIVGDGSMAKELKELAQELELGNSVKFIGKAPHSCLPNYLSRSDIFVSTALSDGNNVSLNEAMACGSFPLATDIPANSQWIRHGENGLLFPKGDHIALSKCIIRAVTEQSLRRSASVLNRELVLSKASWQHFSETMDSLYHLISGDVD